MAILHTSNLALLVLIQLWLSSSAAAQDVFSLFGNGSEAKAHAGAGQLFSRGAPANYYNPANLTASGKTEPYLGLDIAVLAYDYTYPGYETVSTRRTIPLPFFGYVYKPAPNWAIGISALPLPSSSSETEVLGLPTRRLTEDEPIIVNAKTSGNGFGYRLALGGGFHPTNGLDLGLSLLIAGGGTKVQVQDAQSGQDIALTETKATSFQLLFGANGQILKGMVQSAFTIALPSWGKATGGTVIPFFKDDAGNPATVDISGFSKGPLAIGFASLLRLGPLRPFFEWRHEFWQALRTQKSVAGTKKVEVDYFDTDDVVVGVDYGDQHVFTIAAGFYQSHIGEGIIASKAADDKELLGMEIANIDALPYRILSGGYGFPISSKVNLQTGIFYLSGTREVGANAIGYGTYEISLTQVVFGASFRI